MRLHTFTRRSSLLLAAAVLLSGTLGTWAAQNGRPNGPASAPSPTPTVAPKAIFADELLVGRDPFFPESSRRRPQFHENPGSSVNPSSGILNQIMLKGISRDKDRKLVLINNATIAEGEKAQIRINNGQTVTIQCLEIRERSVLISIEGAKEAKEIRFAKDF
jgi:hypothetical protein